MNRVLLQASLAALGVGVRFGLVGGLVGGHAVQVFLLGLASLGQAFARAHIGEGGLVLQRLEQRVS